MSFKDGIRRREFLQYATVSGIAVPLYLGAGPQAEAAVPVKKIFRFPKDLSKLNAEQKAHLPKVTLPPVVEDGSQAPVTVEMDHPMTKDEYIKSIQILNYTDPVVIKGTFYLTPANGEAYIGTQIRLAGGDSTVWVIVECSKHGRYALSKTVKVAAGGC